MSTPSARHWDDVYTSRGTAGVSWFQAVPTLSMELIEALGITPDAAVVDVGGGASALVDHLVDRGFRDLTVLDLSETALEAGRRRIGTAAPVRWLHSDVLTWQPVRRFGLWHDRATFHFLVDETDRLRYLDVLTAGLEVGGALIMATFAEDGPDRCSGLPVARYSPEDLSRVVGAQFAITELRTETHVTPAGTVQPFTWVAGRRLSASAGSGGHQ